MDTRCKPGALRAESADLPQAGGDPLLLERGGGEGPKLGAWKTVREEGLMEEVTRGLSLAEWHTNQAHKAAKAGSWEQRPLGGGGNRSSVWPELWPAGMVLQGKEN